MKRNARQQFKNIVFACLWALVGSGVVLADKSLSDRVVTLTTEKILAHYVLPERRQEIVGHIRKMQKQGAYQGLSGSALADAMTQDLNLVSNDIHLRLTYSPEQFSAMRDDEQSTDATKAYWLEVMASQNAGIERVEWLPGDIAYMKFTGFWADNKAYDKMNGALALMQGAKALIWDLRENRGGEGAMVQYLASLFINDPEPRLLNTGFDGLTNRHWQDYSLSYMPVAKLVGTPLFILTSSRTFSAGEAFAYHARNFGFGTLVGETTAGAGFIVQDIALLDGFVLHISTGTGTHPVTNTSWEGVGVLPHIRSSGPQAFDQALITAYQTLTALAANPDAQRRYAWYAENAAAKLAASQHTASPDQLSFAGDYGERTIAVVNHSLVYRRGDSEWRSLFPLHNSTFAIEGFEDYRMSFLKDRNGWAMRISSVDGSHSIYPKR